MSDERPQIQVRHDSPGLGYHLQVVFKNFSLSWTLTRENSLHLGRALLEEPDVMPPDRRISAYRRGDVVSLAWGYVGHAGGKGTDASAMLHIRPADARWLGEVFLERVKENDQDRSGSFFSRSIEIVAAEEYKLR